MSYTYPKWATKKQLEGMSLFHDIANEYGHFTVTFLPDDHVSEPYYERFYADIRWKDHCHRFDIVWNYEQSWNKHGDEIEEWQFVFAGGDAFREMTSEVFFIDLFFYLDGKYNDQ